MKRLFSSLALTAISIVSVNAQTYTHPTVGQQNTYAGTCEVNTCSGTYYDNGGVGGSAVASGAAGNYTNNINAVYRTFCPSTPGGRVSLTFTAFTLENPGGGPGPGGCWDYMQIGNGPTQNSPVIAQGCGTSLNGATVTSTDASGCLTIRFTSDNTINRLGWAATISCVAGGGPSGTDNYDCINATGICDNGFSFSGLSDGPGLISDDCGGASCVVSENFSNWYEFTVQTSGTLGFDIQVGASGDDYDFAVYQSNSCSALGAPVRCSYAATAGATGLGNGAVDNSEDVSGDGWVAGMNVTAGQHYYLLINEWTPNNSTFTLNWTGTATVNTPTPGFTIGATNYTSPAAYSVCQGDPLTIFANGTGGTYSWWTAPVGGVNLANGISYSPPTGAPGSTNYYLQEVTSSGCTSPRGVITVTVTAPPSATISYASPFCTTAGPQNVTQTGTAGGTYSAAPAGLTINAASGQITPSTSTAGTYTVTYSIPAAGGCAAFSTTASVTITQAPSATISYSGSPWCTTAGVQNVTQTGTAGGTYTAAPAGLSINAATGQITPSTSSAGTYTVTYTIAASGGCAAFTTTASVTITTAPSATISYSGSPWCTTAGVQNVTQTGTAGGTYTAAPAGLSINAATGQITPSTSSAGTYTVTYTIAASGGCAAFTTTASVTITAAPSATISYAGSPFCTTAGPANVTQTGTAGGTYTAAPAGLTINAATGQITPGTSTAGTYTVTYTIAASGGCAAYTTTASVTITTAPSATISYSGSPWCTTAGVQNVTQTGTAGGTYTAAPAGLSINAATGQITPSTSSAGTYTVTYTIAASGGCAAFTTTASVTITAAPSATISYAGSPFCTTAGPANVTQTGTAGGTYTAAPAGLTINAATGQITPSTSSAGTYTVTYTIAASGGCAAFTTTASVTITAAPSATISYAGSPFCTTSGPGNVTQTGTAGGTYTAAPAGLTINAATGQVTPGTSTAGTYTVTYTIP
ncbi:MAG: beta strand repeat-containing protein, partial [Bacteroidota bacterium]